MIARYEEQQYQTMIAHYDVNETKFQIGHYMGVQHENGQAPLKLTVRRHCPCRIIEIHESPQGSVYICFSSNDGKIHD